MKMFINKIKDRLITRLLLANILLAAIPIIITGLLLIRTAQKSIETTIFIRNMEYARKAAQTISVQLSSAHKILKFNADNIYNFNLNRVNREVLLNSMLTEFDIFNEIYLLDTHGKILLSTHYVDDANKFTDRNFLDVTHYFSEIFISDNKLPYMEISEPIYYLGEVNGMLFARINLKVMWDIVDNLIIGEDGEAFIIDSNGTYIAHSERINVYMRNKFKREEILSAATTSVPGHSIYRDEQHEQILAAYAAVELTRWKIIIQQPTREAFAQVRTMKYQTIFLVLSSIILASFIAYIYTCRILRPINNLIAGIQRFSTGDLDYQIVATGHDEIATLVEHFNAMAYKLKEFQKSLTRTERYETLSRVAAILSHEIKNPLNAMVINMQILKKELEREFPDKERMYKFHTIILSEINRVDKLVNNFLLLAKPPKSKKEPLIIQSILTEIVEEQRENTQTHSINVLQNFYDKAITVFADASGLKQAFLNIYINAIQAMTTGGTITLSLYPLHPFSQFADRGSVKIEFQDTGPGIDESQKDKIFDFYYTTKSDGTGLGLAISQQIIEDHGGTIEVESKDKNGATFIITLPIALI